MAVHRLERVERAESIGRRFFGLMGRRDLSDVCLWFPRCRSIHTCFMHGSIDVVFLDASHTVVGLHAAVRPWRLVNAQARTARSALELSTGRIGALSLRLGDEVQWA